MKKTIQLLIVTSVTTCFGLAAWHGYKEPKVEVKETVKIVPPKEVDAHVFLTKWQLTKMLKTFEEDAHPADTLKFKTVVKSLNSSCLLKSILLSLVKKSIAPSGMFFAESKLFEEYPFELRNVTLKF